MNYFSPLVVLLRIYIPFLSCSISLGNMWSWSDNENRWNGFKETGVSIFSQFPQKPFELSFSYRWQCASETSALMASLASLSLGRGFSFHLLPASFHWTCWRLNLGPSASTADALPLRHGCTLEWIQQNRFSAHIIKRHEFNFCFSCECC